MKRVHIIHDPYKLDESTVADVENPLEYLKSEFKDGFPEHAKIYKGSIAVENDITEKLQKDELLINLIDEDIYIVCYPAIAWAAIAAVVSIVSSVFSVFMYLTMPKNKAQAPQSSNNELVARTNNMRINGRVPDIYGTVRSYPDLIAEPYTYFNSEGIEIERSLLCIGYGHYLIRDCKDSMTDVVSIPGTSISVYDPDTSIVGTPNYKVGRTFDDLPKQVVKSKSITGQTLVFPNDNLIESDDLYYTIDGEIHSRTGADFTEFFSVGDTLMISGAIFSYLNIRYSGTMIMRTDGAIEFESTIDYPEIETYKLAQLTGASVLPSDPGIVDFSGTYTVESVDKTLNLGIYKYIIYLKDPEMTNPAWVDPIFAGATMTAGLLMSDTDTAVTLDGTYIIEDIQPGVIKLEDFDVINPAWLQLSDFEDSSTESLMVETALSRIENKWVGWFNLVHPEATEVYFNFKLPQGLYFNKKKGGTGGDWQEYRIEWQYINAAGAPVGPVYAYQKRIYELKMEGFGFTEIIELPTPGSIRFRVCSLREYTASNAVTTMLIKDVFSTSNNPKDIYEGVTIVQSETVGNDGSYSMKERKLNLLVTRKLPADGTGALVATNSAAQALIHAAICPHIGRRSISEVDVTQIKLVESDVIDYFDSVKAAEFSYTIDDDNLSFEEIAGMIASTAFCEAYRYGNKLRWKFDKPQENSVLLFNHANTVPGNFKKTKSFMIENRYDGVEVEYTSPDDDLRVKYVASDSAYPVNTQKVKTSGIRTHEQAKTRAWREWNKLKYRNITCEFEALEESELLARNDRILVADNTVIKTKDGIIDHIDGLTLGLSHPIESDVPYLIYLQLADGRVDIVPCGYVDEYTVLLSRPPLIALVPEFTTYQLIESTETPSNAFMVTEIRPQGKMTNMLTCVNYDERYYQNDADFF